MTYAVDFHSLVDAYKGGQISFEQLLASFQALMKNGSAKDTSGSKEAGKPDEGSDGRSGEPGTSKGGGQSPILKLTEHSDGVDKLKFAYKRGDGALKIEIKLDPSEAIGSGIRSVDIDALKDKLIGAGAGSVEIDKIKTEDDKFELKLMAHDFPRDAFNDLESLDLRVHDRRGRCIDIQLCEFKKSFTPIALDLNGDGKIGVTGATSSVDKDANAELGRTVEFDIDGDGDLDVIEWYAGGDGILVDNTDGRAAEDMDGSRLFGDEGGKYGNGYEKLAALDADGSGAIEGAEADALALWMDDGDAVVEAGELVSLADAGVASVSTQMRVEEDGEGRRFMRSEATMSDGSIVMTEDVHFAAAIEGEGGDANADPLAASTSGPVPIDPLAAFSAPVDLTDALKG